MKRNEKICFCILHYQTTSDTVRCISSIMKICPTAPIVVVDNASPNRSGTKLCNIYDNSPDVKIIVNKENLGFAKGNNIGINYLRDHYNADFICVMNNDTWIEQESFLKEIEDEYNKSKFAVLGPKIITLDGSIKSNPLESPIKSKKDIELLIFKRKIKLVINKMNLSFLVNNSGENAKHTNTYDNNKRYINVKLHGACLIFSREFFSKLNGFCEDTFLFFEEEILYKNVLDNGLLTVYDPKVSIHHHEDGATNAVHKSSKEKNIFVLSHEIESLKILIKMY